MTRTCRLCGCTDRRACVTAGVPCHWVAPEVCSACVLIPAALAARFADLDRRLATAYAPVARFWSEEYGCSAARAREIEEEAYGENYRHYQRQRWAALRALWTAQSAYDARRTRLHIDLSRIAGQGDDLDGRPPAFKFVLRCLCTIAILLNRRGGVSIHRALDLAFWDNRRDGYGWSCWSLDFDPLLLRYAAETDGDSFY